MEIEYYSYKFDGQERFYSQSVLIFILALGLFLWGNLIVFANPSTSKSIEEDSKIPLSKRVFDSSGEWRTPQESKNKWRESEEHKLTLQKSRIKKKTSSLYDPTKAQDNWDPYSSPGHPDTLTRPAKVFEFKF
jgi:hypothetical protein